MTTEEQILQLKLELEELKSLSYKDNFSALQVIKKQQQLADGVNLELGSSDGTKIGTATTQKLGFFNKTPIVQVSAISSPNAEVNSLKTAVDLIITALKNLGLTA